MYFKCSQDWNPGKLSPFWYCTRLVCSSTHSQIRSCNKEVCHMPSLLTSTTVSESFTSSCREVRSPDCPCSLCFWSVSTCHFTEHWSKPVSLQFQLFVSRWISLIQIVQLSFSVLQPLLLLHESNLISFTLTAANNIEARSQSAFSTVIYRSRLRPSERLLCQSTLLLPISGGCHDVYIQTSMWRSLRKMWGFTIVILWWVRLAVLFR